MMRISFQRSKELFWDKRKALTITRSFKNLKSNFISQYRDLNAYAPKDSALEICHFWKNFYILKNKKFSYNLVDKDIFTGVLCMENTYIHYYSLLLYVWGYILSIIYIYHAFLILFHRRFSDLGKNFHYFMNYNSEIWFLSRPNLRFSNVYSIPFGRTFDHINSASFLRHSVSRFRRINTPKLRIGGLFHADLFMLFVNSILPIQRLWRGDTLKNSPHEIMNFKRNINPCFRALKNKTFKYIKSNLSPCLNGQWTIILNINKIFKWIIRVIVLRFKILYKVFTMCSGLIVHSVQTEMYKHNKFSLKDIKGKGEEYTNYPRNKTCRLPLKLSNYLWGKHAQTKYNIFKTIHILGLGLIIETFVSSIRGQNTYIHYYLPLLNTRGFIWSIFTYLKNAFLIHFHRHLFDLETIFHHFIDFNFRGWFLSGPKNTFRTFIPILLDVLFDHINSARFIDYNFSSWFLSGPNKQFSNIMSILFESRPLKASKNLWRIFWININKHEFLSWIFKVNPTKQSPFLRLELHSFQGQTDSKNASK